MCVIYWTVVLIFIVVCCNNVSTAVSSSLLYKDVIEIMTSLFFMSINPRRLTRSEKQKCHYSKNILLFWTPCLTNSQTLKMISQVKSFSYPDKQRTLKEGYSNWNTVLQLTTIKMKIKVRKIMQNIVHQGSSQKFRQMRTVLFRIWTQVAKSTSDEITVMSPVFPSIHTSGPLSPRILIIFFHFFFFLILRIGSVGAREDI